jgi:hypothetical protein
MGAPFCDLRDDDFEGFADDEAFCGYERKHSIRGGFYEFDQVWIDGDGVPVKAGELDHCGSPLVGSSAVEAC